MILQKKFPSIFETGLLHIMHGQLDRNCFFIWGFLNTCLHTTVQPVTHCGTFLSICQTHVLEIVAVHLSSFTLNPCGCAEVLQELLIFEFRFHYGNIGCLLLFRHFTFIPAFQLSPHLV